ncbi:MAG: Fur family transcriptional regulator, partial [Candidatus Promineifilaceae bacterium]|nr:Fur family transcriptional regulator [Candidatus Promineifilaceae bacterium]
LGKTLRQNGHRLTRARRAILEALVASGGHVSADELVDLVREGAPSVGRMTVYRTLDLLQELSLIRPVYQGTGAAHFVLMEDGHHHHLVCTACQQVFEFDDCAAQEIGQMLSNRFNFQIEGHLLEFYGLCPDCRPAQ